jgi:hypothetical protein
MPRHKKKLNNTNTNTAHNTQSDMDIRPYACRLKLISIVSIFFLHQIIERVQRIDHPTTNNPLAVTL